MKRHSIRLATTLGVVALAFLSSGLQARPYSLKISSLSGAEQWEYSRGDDNAWVLERRSPGLQASKRPLSKQLRHESLFEDIRRSFVLHQSSPRKRPCAGSVVELELGGLLAPRHKSLCLDSMVDRALLGRIYERLGEAQGEPRSKRPLFVEKPSSGP